VNRIVIAGGTGLIGKALVKEFGQAGYEVVVLSRSGRPIEGAKSLKWDAKALTDWTKELEGATAVINLTGEPVGQRWTEETKRKILESRVESSKAIAAAIAQAKTPPKVWVNSSAVGYYGDTGDKETTEAGAPGQGFLAEVCVKWEAAVQEADLPGTREVRLRAGVVFAKDGGVFEILKKITKLFIGGAAGSGRQFVPWIHIDDIAGLYRWAVETDVSGPVNGVAPEPIRNADLMTELRRALGRPWAPPAPKPILSLVTGIIGIPAETVLGSCRVVPAVALERGFEFEHPDLRASIDELVK
jgi:uncharacterized protein